MKNLKMYSDENFKCCYSSIIGILRTRLNEKPLIIYSLKVKVSPSQVFTVQDRTSGGVVCPNFGHPAPTSSFTIYLFLLAKNSLSIYYFVACLQHLKS